MNTQNFGTITYMVKHGENWSKWEISLLLVIIGFQPCFVSELKDSLEETNGR